VVSPDDPPGGADSATTRLDDCPLSSVSVAGGLGLALGRP
jgi:hypothetical protein